MILLNGEKVDVTIFPDKTSQVWKLPEINEAIVKLTWDFDNEGEFMHLAQLKCLLDSMNIKSFLHMPYLPYARQDKDVSNKSTFALEPFCHLLNTLGFITVTVLDPHSNVAGKLINNFWQKEPISYITRVKDLSNPDVICFPDLGANKRYKELFELSIRKIYGYKKRNFETGYIEDYRIINDDVDIVDKSILVIDDICDGGMTFILLTQKLKKLGVKEVNLYTTHGIFSKGLKPLKEAGINRIFTSKGEVSELDNNICYKEMK